MELELPRADGTVERYVLRHPDGSRFRPPGQPLRSRVVYAAAHVVPDPDDPGRLDWDATLAFRRHLWSWGLGVADAMDTAQRGAGLEWPAVRELIARSGAEARAVGGALACGAATDQLPAGAPASLDAIAGAYLEQCEAIAAAGALPVLMASRHLAAAARGPEDYLEVYGRVLGQSGGPVLLHWLGEPFDPQLAGYWGSRDLDVAADVVLLLCKEHAARIVGVKVSLLDAAREVDLRRRLPAGVRCFTGDDYHYPALIRGDEAGYSDALLGIFDAIAPAAATAVAALDAGDGAGFDAALGPTVPLARHVFAPPTPHYKTGLVLLAHLNGHQDTFRMVADAERHRSPAHLAETLRLADAAGLLDDPERAVERMRLVLAAAEG